MALRLTNVRAEEPELLGHKAANDQTVRVEILRACMVASALGDGTLGGLLWELATLATLVRGRNEDAFKRLTRDVRREQVRVWREQGGV